MEFQEIVQKITEKTGLAEAEIQRRVTDKQQELSGLVSKEGAAYIISKEMGLDLLKKERKKFEIKDIAPGIRNLTLKARVYRIFDTREFEFKGRKGKVANIILADPTGTIRMSLWDSQIEILKGLNINDPVEIFGAYIKEDGMGGTEVRVSRRGGIRKLDEIDFPVITQVQQKVNRNDIANMQEGNSYETRAAIVQIFDGVNPFFEICPECGKRVKKDEDFTCPTHGKVEPAYSIVLSGVIDDGTGNIRSVFFRDSALKLIGMDLEKALENKSELFTKLDVLGKEYILTGRVNRNKMFNRPEFIVNDVKEADIKEEAEKLINSFSSND